MSRPQDNLRTQSTNPGMDINFNVGFLPEQEGQEFQSGADIAGVLTETVQTPGMAQTSTDKQLNLFAEMLLPLFEKFTQQSIGRLMGEMPQESDKKIMLKLLDYLPRKSQELGHAVMANVAGSIAGDPQGSAIAAEFLKEKQSNDSRLNALKFGIHKLADPKTSPSTVGSIMAGMRNYWDDIYGPDKSLKMTQSIGFLAQIGSVFEALMNKSQTDKLTQMSHMSTVMGGAGDPLDDLTHRYNSAISRMEAYAKTRKDKKTVELDEDPIYSRDKKLAEYLSELIQRHTFARYGGNPEQFSDADLSQLGY